MIGIAEELGAEVGLRRACVELAVPRSSVYRRRRAPAKGCVRRSSCRALSEVERQSVRDLLYSEEHVDKSPWQVYATLLDNGSYICSPRTMYRILAEDEASRERRNQRKHPEYTKPELLASRPNQVWTWDITKLRGPEKWSYFYLYSILDIYSRYTVGWMVAHQESTDLAKRLIAETAEKQGVEDSQLTLHSDRGPSMASHGVAQLLATLGITKSHSRPHVSNDNPFSESQFKTLKYRPDFPNRFANHDDALSFCRQFFAWYNDEHRHSGIGFMTPAMVHHGRDKKVTEARQCVLHQAFSKHPERFVHGLPSPPLVPPHVYINPPSKSAKNEKRPPEPQCP